MPDRVVVQYDKRDVETMKLIKLDLLGPRDARRHRRVRPAHRARLRRVPRPRPDARGDPRGVRDAPGGGHRRRVPGRVTGPDADAAQVAARRASTTSWSRWRSSGRAPSRATPSTRTCAASRAWSPCTYLHPSLEPILHDTLGVILYQEQVMKIAIDVAGFTPAGSDGFRRAMGTWRSTPRDGEAPRAVRRRLHREPGHDRATTRRSCSARCAAFASFGFAKSHAAAFARTAYESSFLKLFYPAQFTVGLINAQPMGFYPVEVLVNDAKRHGVAVLPVDVNRSAYRTTTEWVGRPGWALAGRPATTARTTTTRASRCPTGAGIDAPARGPCARPRASIPRRRRTRPLGGRVDDRLGHPAGAAPRQGDRRGADGAARRGARPGAVHEPRGRRGADGAAGGGDRAADPGRRRSTRWAGRGGSCCGSCARWRARRRGASTGGRCAGAGGTNGPPAGRWTCGCRRPRRRRCRALTEPERLGDAYAVVGLDARRQVV